MRFESIGKLRLPANYISLAIAAGSIAAILIARETPYFEYVTLALSAVMYVCRALGLDTGTVIEMIGSATGTNVVIPETPSLESMPEEHSVNQVKIVKSERSFASRLLV